MSDALEDLELPLITKCVSKFVEGFEPFHVQETLRIPISTAIRVFDEYKKHKEKSTLHRLLRVGPSEVSTVLNQPDLNTTKKSLPATIVLDGESLETQQELLTLLQKKETLDHHLVGTAVLLTKEFRSRLATSADMHTLSQVTESLCKLYDVFSKTNKSSKGNIQINTYSNDITEYLGD